MLKKRISFAYSLLLFTLAIPGQRLLAAQCKGGNGFVEELCGKHLRDLTSTHVDELNSVCFDVAPQAARAAASKRYTGGARIFLELPIADDQFRRVYGHDAVVSVKDEREMESLRGQITTGLGLKAHDGLSETAFRKTISSAPNDAVIIIVGHNDHGTFHFIDGSNEGIADLANECASAGHLCVFVSCKSNRYITGQSAVGIDRAIGLKAAVELSEKISAYIGERNGQGVSAQDLVLFVKGIRIDNKKPHNARLLVMKGCGDVKGKTVIAVYVHAHRPCPANKPNCDND
jgi:hypothetical protein